MDHTGTKIIIIGGYNNKTGYLNSVDLLSNVDDTIDKWMWGELHGTSTLPEDCGDARNFDGILYKLFFQLYLIFKSLWML